MSSQELYVDGEVNERLQISQVTEQKMYGVTSASSLGHRRMRKIVRSVKKIQTTILKLFGRLLDASGMERLQQKSSGNYAVSLEFSGNEAAERSPICII